MQNLEERRFPTRYKVEGLSTRITESDGKEVQTPNTPIPIEDINHYGALLHGAKPPGHHIKISLLRNSNQILEDKEAITRDTTRKGTDQKDYTPIMFSPPLSYGDLCELDVPAKATRQTHPGIWNLLLADIQLVKDEILTIERCRSDIFLAIITSIFLVAATIGSFAIDPEMRLRAVSVTSLLTFLMFILGSVTTIEKAKALNMRRAFHTVLSRYIAQDWLPCTYSGWAILKYTFLTCGARRKLERCARKVPKKSAQAAKNKHKKHVPRNTNSPNNKEESCLFLATDEAFPINCVKRFMPGLTDSFMSTCSYIYITLYLLSIAVLFLVIVRVVPGWVGGETGQSLSRELQVSCLVLYVLGVAASLTLLARFQKLILVVCAAAMLTLSATFWLFDVGSVKQHEALIALVVSLVGFAVGSVGSYLIRSLYSIRQGKDSYDTYYYAWQRVIRHCVPICEDVSIEKAPEVKGFQKFLRCVACCR